MNEDLQNKATELTSKEGSLGSKAYNSITNIVKGIHGDYSTNALDGNKKDAAIGMSDLNGVVAGVEGIKQTGLDIAEAVNDGDLSAWNDSEYTQDNKDLFAKFISDDKELSRNKEGQLGMKHNGKFYSNTDINNLLNESKKDYRSTKDLRELVIGATNLGKEDKGIGDVAKTSSFNEDTFKSQIMDVVKKGNLKSLYHDPILEGKAFVDEMMEMPELKSITYKSLGLTPPKSDDDGMINETLTKPDMSKIATALAESDMGAEVIGKYFVDIVKQNFAKAAGKSTGEMANMSAADIIKNFRNK